VLDLGEGGFGQIEAGLDYGSLADAPVTPGFIDRRPPAATWSSYRTRVLAQLPGMRAHNARLTAIYQSALAHVALPAGYHDWRFNIRVPAPARLIDALFAAGLFASRHYRPMAGDGAFPVAEELFSTVVNLFNDHHYDEAMAHRTVEVVLGHMGGVSAG
jgi:hypothetical protein